MLVAGNLNHSKEPYTEQPLRIHSIQIKLKLQYYQRHEFSTLRTSLSRSGTPLNSLGTRNRPTLRSRASLTVTRARKTDYTTGVQLLPQRGAKIPGKGGSRFGGWLQRWISRGVALRRCIVHYLMDGFSLCSVDSLTTGPPDCTLRRFSGAAENRCARCTGGIQSRRCIMNRTPPPPPPPLWSSVRASPTPRLPRGRLSPDPATSTSSYTLPLHPCPSRVTTSIPLINLLFLRITLRRVALRAAPLFQPRRYSKNDDTRCRGKRAAPVRVREPARSRSRRLDRAKRGEWLMGASVALVSEYGIWDFWE